MLLFLAFIFAAHFLAKGFGKIGLPGLVAMLLLGLVLGTGLSLSTDLKYLSSTDFSLIHLNGGQVHFLKELALVIILLRAGFGLSLKDLQGHKTAGLKMGVLPMLAEMSMVTFLAVTLFNWSLWEGLLVATVVSAVSPAIIVPRMLVLQENKKVPRGIPATILLGSSLDDILALLLFGVLVSFGLAGGEVWSWVLNKGLISVLTGMALGWGSGYCLSKLSGVLWSDSGLMGWLSAICLVILAIVGKHMIDEGQWLVHPLLLIIFLAMSLLHHGGDLSGVKDCLKKCWDWAQIPLFMIIGMQLDLTHLPEIAGWGLLKIFFGLISRSIGVWLSLLGTNWSPRVRLFVVMSYLPKATVQAAIGAVVLEMSLAGHSNFRESVGASILAVAVLSILVTAPLGAWLMDRHNHWLSKE